MIKQILIKNLYNFKNESVIDFSCLKPQSLINFQQFNQTYIGTFTLVYGKNNIGKSNLLRLISEIFQFVQNSKCLLKANDSELKDESSLFEITFIDGDHEFRYGVEMIINHHPKIIDEWLYVHINHSKRETLIFDRDTNKFHASIKKHERMFVSNINDHTLYYSILKTTNNEYINLITRYIKQIATLGCLDNKCLVLDDTIEAIYNDNYKMQLLIDCMTKIDTGIIDITIQKYDQKELKLIKDYLENDLILNDDQDQTIKQKLRNLTNQNFSESKQKYLFNFTNKYHNHYSYYELSSGTKQIFNIFLFLIATIDQEKLLIFDELENGLHKDITLFILEFMNSIKNNKNQYLITTHEADLLDCPFISNDNKVILRNNYKSDNEIEIDYISNYHIKKDQILSKRYLLDAFEVGPDING